MNMSRRRSTKKLINCVDDCVDESLSGFVATNDRLRLVAEHRIVVRADYETHVGRKVALLAGGGSGHEPTFAGFVGKGCLTAAVAGSVFASPPSSNILAALRLLHGNGNMGTLVIVANYTGDRLNFGLAIEQAKSEGHRIESFLVNEDCALVSGNKAVGRRGLCGIVLVMKIAGSMAEQGFCLDDILSRLRALSGGLGTVGMCVSPCSLPGMMSMFELDDDEMELGLGVHGEAGVARMKFTTAKETLNILFTHMMKPENASGLRLTDGPVCIGLSDRVVVLINNLGGTSNLEMYVAAYEAIRWLESRGNIVERVFVAPLMTSLEMAGISVTLLKVDNDVLVHVDSATSAPGWPSCYQVTDSGRISREVSRIDSTKLRERCSSNILDESRANDEPVVEHDEGQAECLRIALEAACRSLVAHREFLNELDRGCGDGDCGNTLAAGAERVLSCLSSGSLDVGRPSIVLGNLSNICQVTMGGCSGALYGIFFASAAAVLKRAVVNVAWRDAVVAGFQAIAKYGGAEPGDRTMLDSLHALIVAWNVSIESKSVQEVARSMAVAVRSAAESTSGMMARAGRATYVNAAYWNRPDPGAIAIALIIEAIAETAFHSEVNG